MASGTARPQIVAMDFCPDAPTTARKTVVCGMIVKLVTIWTHVLAADAPEDLDDKPLFSNRELVDLTASARLLAADAAASIAQSWLLCLLLERKRDAHPELTPEIDRLRAEIEAMRK